MHFCFRKRIHHQMECATVDGRGSAVHSHGALYASVRTADSELRRPSGKEPSCRSPEEGVIDDTRKGTGEYWIPKVHRVSFAGSALFAERTDYGALVDRKCACKRVTGLRPTDTNLFWSEMDSDFALCTACRSNSRSSRIGLRDFHDSEILRNFILIKRPSRRW